MGEGGRSSIFSPLDGEIRDPEFYRELGFRSGLEIHQQLRTDKKLFCHCPAGVYVDTHDAEILRHMRPTLSELGEYDGAALMEFKTKKEIVYLLHRENVCTYEMDDTPPFIMNQEALDIALEAALLVNCQLVNEVHIIRKQYLDGSIPTGFQRTAIVGVNGHVPFRGREIQIIQVAVEEDSCRQVANEGHRITFRTDRLNMPLSEVVTGPDMRTPEEVAAVCDLLGRIARVTGHVRRGAGSVREDVNVSVEGGTRVEIKGVSRIKYIPKLTHNEAMRQSRLLGIRDHLRDLGLTDASIDGGSHDVTRLVARTRSPLLQKAIAAGGEVRLQILRRCRKVLRAYTQPGLFFAQELSGRVRVIACLDSPANLFIRDEEHGIGLARQDSRKHLTDHLLGPSAQEWKDLAREIHASEEDGLVLVFGRAEDAPRAADEVRDRMREALKGVPNETRMSFPSGRTDFERILPGPDRMYPDTDLPPMRVDDARVERITASLPELPWKREERLAAMGLSAQQVREMAISPHFHLFLELAEGATDDTRRRGLAWCLTELLRALRRKDFPVASLAEEDLSGVLDLYASGRLQREGLPVVLQRLAWLRASGVGSEPRKNGVDKGLASILSEEFPELSLTSPVAGPTEEDVTRLAAGLDATRLRSEIERVRGLMKAAMVRYRGAVPGRTLRETVEAWCRTRPLEETARKAVVDVGSRKGSLRRKEGRP